MSARAWIDQRTPAPPASLAARIAALYDAAPAHGPNDAPEGAPSPARCVEAAAATVGTLIEGAATTRASALDLLAADALATYAFELASDRPESLAALADEAMRRFAGLAAVGERAPGADGPS